MEKIHSELACETRAGESEAIKKIESRTKEDMITLLKTNHLGINRRIKLQDYSIAKKICFGSMFIDSEIYDKQIGWICDYLKI